MPKVLISGGTGLIGRQLCRRLQEEKYEIAILSRTKNHEIELPVYLWNPDRNIVDEEAFVSADYIIHLAGVNIGGKRWTPERKRQILDSRIKSAELLFNQVRKLQKKPKAFITASAVGYYGAITSEEVMDETRDAFDDFLGQTCKEWEKVADHFTDIGIRSVKIRTGIVLSNHGGALPKLTLPVRLGIGSPLGSGNQYLPWIHIDDLCNIYIHAVKNMEMIGAFNAVAPQHLNNREFIKTIAYKLGKSIWFPNIPVAVLRLIFGRMSDMLIYGSMVSSEKIIAAGYKFIYPELESALEDLLCKKLKKL